MSIDDLRNSKQPGRLSSPMITQAYTRIPESMDANTFHVVQDPPKGIGDQETSFKFAPFHKSRISNRPLYEMRLWMMDSYLSVAVSSQPENLRSLRGSTDDGLTKKEKRYFGPVTPARRSAE